MTKAEAKARIDAMIAELAELDQVSRLVADQRVSLQHAMRCNEGLRRHFANRRITISDEIDRLRGGDDANAA